MGSGFTSVLLIVRLQLGPNFMGLSEELFARMVWQYLQTLDKKTWPNTRWIALPELLVKGPLRKKTVHRLQKNHVKNAKQKGFILRAEECELCVLSFLAIRIEITCLEITVNFVIDYCY